MGETNVRTVGWPIVSNAILGRILLGILIGIGAYVAIQRSNLLYHTDTMNAVVALAPHEHTRGDRAADVRVFLYSDIDCPYCHGFFLNSLPLLMQEFGSRVVLVYRHFPIVSLHPNAERESEIAECAYNQKGEEAFWSLIDAMYRSIDESQRVRLSDLPAIEENLGIDQKLLTQCIEFGHGLGWVQQGVIDGALASVNKTPSVVVENVRTGARVMVSGAAYANTKAAIETILNE